MALPGEAPLHAPDGVTAGVADGVAAGGTLPEVTVPPRAAARGLPVRAVEIATALGFMAIGAAAIWDSARLGAGWGPDGPRSGYFPFWIGVLLVAAAAGQLFAALHAARAAGGELRGRQGPLFLTWEQARTLGTVLIPTVAYVAAIPFFGIYLASALLVAWFMVRLGGFRLMRAVPAGIATAIVTFVVFEIWFLVALPKGPIEDLLGF